MDWLIRRVQKEKQQGKPPQKVQAWEDIVSKNHERSHREFQTKCQGSEARKNGKDEEF